MKALSEEARAARARYAREWRKKNPDKERANHERYWERRAARTAEAEKSKKAQALEGD